MTGGQITGNGANVSNAGIDAFAVAGAAVVTMTGGTITTAGTAADGIRAQSTRNTFRVDVSGGSVALNTTLGAAIHTLAAASGTINIGAGAVIDGSSSGVAIQDGDLAHNGVDEIGGNSVVTTAGTLRGAVRLGGGSDVVNVLGGTIDGNITGSGAAGLNFDLGAGSFTYGAPYTISGMNSVVMTSGALQIDGALNANTLALTGSAFVLNGTANATASTTINTNSATINGALNTGTLVFNGGTFLLNNSANATTERAFNSNSATINGTLSTGTLAVN